MSPAVADTNVLIAAAAGYPGQGPVARAALLRAGTVWAPTTAFMEAANIGQKLVRGGVRSLPEVDVILGKVEATVTRPVPVPDLWKAAVRLSVKHQHPAFDMLFVALAERENLSLVTFDNPLRTKCPHVCEAPAAFAARP